MSKHTKEPWSHAYRENGKGMFSEEVFDGNGDVIATLAWHQVKTGNVTTTDREANARRIVACVNACAGIPTENLEEKTVVVSHDYNLANIKQQRDELLAALKLLENSVPLATAKTPQEVSAWNVAYAAIAKAEDAA